MENTFGICASRFRIFRRAIIAITALVIATTKAVVTLHNFLMYANNERRDRYSSTSCVDEDMARGVDSCGMLGVGLVGSTNYGKEAKIVRDNFRDYFISEQGSLPW